MGPVRLVQGPCTVLWRKGIIQEEEIDIEILRRCATEWELIGQLGESSRDVAGKNIRHVESHRQGLEWIFCPAQISSLQPMRLISFDGGEDVRAKASIHEI